MTISDLIIPETKPGEMIAYVDGSYNKKTKTYGSGGLIIFDGNVQEFSFPGTNPLKATMRNVAGEIDASMAAMYIASKAECVKTLKIYHDYEGVAKWCVGNPPWKANTQWTTQYKQYYNEMSKRFTIEFIKVTAHSDDQLNNYVDLLAKKACGL